MISNKKSHAMKMLQLALALSMLQVDPDNYFNRGWDSQLELHDGDGWELEMLRAVPMVEYPYANRKTMMPLIDDLIQFDRQNTNNYNVTAYLLNVQNGQSNQTATATAELVEPPAAASVDQSTSIIANPNPNATIPNSVASPEIDFLLNSEHFQDQLSIWEQNIADLNDFGDLASSNPYSGLPLKDEPLDSSYFDFQLNVEECHEEEDVETAGATASNGTSSDGVKLENPTDDDKDSQRPDASEANKVKTENTDDDDDDECNTQSSPFMNTVELTKEESEIVEVLWKQDVDLGYTLSPPILPSNDSIPSEKSYSSNDDVEKLKALEELKRDKLKDEEENVDDIDDEWAGIPFTIDNETGEYIRLPLDELLNDVLQLAELAAEDNESNNNNDDSIASTSQAANNKAKFQSSSSSSGANGYGSEENRSDTIASGTTTTTTTASASGEPFLSTEDDLPQSEIEVSSLPSPLFDLDDEAKEELADLDIMIQSAAPPFHHRSVQNYAVGGANSAFRQSTGFHHHHPHSHHHHHQGRVPTLSRGVSMEQRLQDIASLFNPIPSMGVGVGVVGDMPPYPHYPTHYPYQGGAAIPPPQHSQFPHTHSHHHMLHNTSLGDICAAQPHYGHNLGSAVSSSMHLTNSSHDSDGASGNSAYKMEHDMMYYSNASSDLNHTTDGFINSILNDEDLHLMDMNVNDSFCSMRMVDVNSTSNNSSALGSTSGLSSGVGASGGLLPISMSSSNSMHGVGVGAGISGPTTTAATTVGGASGGGMTSDMINVVSGADRLDASSDSAVSSMGSERVPSLSDGEWGDGSDSAQDYHQGKYGGPYDYSYNPRLHDGGVGSRQPPVAQKKHQMFGKRYLQEHPAATVANGMHPSIKYEYEPYATAPSAESAAAAGSLHQGQEAIGLNADGAVGPQPQLLHKEHQDSMSVLMPDIKYGGYSLDFSLRPPRTPHEIINHNHTYTLPQGMGSNPRPQHRDKKAKRNSEDEHLTRDEKRARALNVPITVGDIINLPMDEFNERLSKYDLTENQLSLIRDIRRRGKNKVAAQNCRKRKLDQILSLEDEVKEVRRRKDHLLHERDVLSVERKRIANKFATLHRHIFQYLRDSEGNPCSASEYSLQQAADGSIYLLPRDSCKSDAAARATGLNTSSNGNSSSNQQQAPPHHNNNPHHHHPHPQQHPHHHHQQQHQTASAQHPHQQGPSTSTSSHHHHHNQQHHTHPHQQQQTQLQQHQSHPHPHQKD